MRKTYLYMFIVTLLALVIFASGCTNQQGNQTNQSTTGSYSVNGLNFNYPLDWVLIDQTIGNTHFINLADQSSVESNGTKGSSAVINSLPKSENISYEIVKNDLTNSTGIDFNSTNGTVDIAGLKANMTTFTGTDGSGNQTQVKLIYFEKDNFVYTLHFIVTGGVDPASQQQYFDTIINSFQVP
jgi:hypothetical protein